ncbi:MAG: hypothetical protein JOZ60_06820 [Verrucomicrobia bacterium]|nr:hypothetical protein [Verrucomicrobiota bacterium]
MSLLDRTRTSVENEYDDHDEGRNDRKQKNIKGEDRDSERGIGGLSHRLNLVGLALRIAELQQGGPLRNFATPEF